RKDRRRSKKSFSQRRMGKASFANHLFWAQLLQSARAQRRRVPDMLRSKKAQVTLKKEIPAQWRE
ncbi:MAG: hypothetical protein IKW79_07820, partial [Schwartzia sp.]|nr:hypothetical protein [Schwartzia sp. (in: firmicutes)]